ncbi:MAG: bfce, partial [Daejeonella sp.]|nr:bfce [Daejeonella sp.]
QLYETIEEKSFDIKNEGYFEAFTRKWDLLDDLRLSAKDDNEKKTMNTHLHVLEAYTNLYRIWPDENLKDQIARLIVNFVNHMIDKDTHHLILFSDENWVPKSSTVSYGHDIEAAWLLLEAAEVIHNKQLINLTEKLSIKMANAAATGLDADGGLWYEYEPSKNHLVKEKHWWVQAEAMVGFFNAFELSADIDFLNKSYQSWEFVKNMMLDRLNGEWFWGILETGKTMPGEDKVGLWKCPYHNSRACIEIIKRIAVLENKNFSEIESTHI